METSLLSLFPHLTRFNFHLTEYGKENSHMKNIEFELLMAFKDKKLVDMTAEELIRVSVLSFL